VYAKPPFGGPERVLKYLARYTHRVAISNHRLRSLETGNVSFAWKDYDHGNQTKNMTLDAVEFIRRFLLHVLPSGFVRIRQFSSAQGLRVITWKDKGLAYAQVSDLDVKGAESCIICHGAEGGRRKFEGLGKGI